jgi:hypothetical protein
MTGKLNMNFPNFFEAEEQLTKAGWKVLNPARMDYELYGWPESRGYEEPKVELKDFVWRDLRAIMTLTQAFGDAIIMLPGWDDSKGARCEKALGEWLGLRILTLEEALSEQR